jgi:putative membrane protein
MPHLHHPAYDLCALWLTSALSIAALVYLRGWTCLRFVHSNAISACRAGSFLFGLFLIWFAIASPVARFDHELLTVHMVRHLLLMTIAPPLLWLGEPILAFVYGLPAPVVQGAIGPFRWSPLRRLGSVFASPTFCWLAAALTLVGWHVPAVFSLGMRSEMWHGIEQASFLLSGLLFWSPVVQPWPTVARWPEWSMLLYLFLATLPCDVLSAFLVFCDRGFYATYFSASRPFLTSALEDQQCAGALMWTCVTIVYMVAGTVLAVRLLAPQRPRKYGAVESGVQDRPVQGGVARVDVLQVATDGLTGNQKCSLSA